LREEIGFAAPVVMPPEQLRGEPVDARADIYTIGAVLYEMATARRTYPEEQTSRLIDAILHQPPVVPRALNSRISTELEPFILKCLDKDPDRHYHPPRNFSWTCAGSSHPLPGTRRRHQFGAGLRS